MWEEESKHLFKYRKCFVLFRFVFFFFHFCFGGQGLSIHLKGQNDTTQSTCRAVIDCCLEILALTYGPGPHRTIWSHYAAWTIDNLEEFSKANTLQPIFEVHTAPGHVGHCSRNMFVIILLEQCPFLMVPEYI